MAQNQNVKDRRLDLGNVKFQPATAQLRPLLPARCTERRNLASRRSLVRRVHSEFLEMPGLTLSTEQAARLFSLPPSACTRIFDELLHDRLLRVTVEGRYALAKRSA